MFNHNRGLWGYTGEAADGELLTIQSTGMGGPSAAIVLEELCDLGLQRAIRVGTCGALQADLHSATSSSPTPRSPPTARAARSAPAIAWRPTPGSSRRCRTPRRAARAADGAAARTATGLIATSDLFYDRDHARPGAWRAAGALAVEMEAATLLRSGNCAGSQSAACSR